jgi:hypothetical protein
MPIMFQQLPASALPLFFRRVLSLPVIVYLKLGKEGESDESI